MHPLIKELGRALGRQLDRLNTFIESPKVVRIIVGLAVVVIGLVFVFHKSPEEQISDAGLVQVQLQSKPAGAKIMLFNEDTGKITPASMPLDPKRPYSFVLNLEGYEPSEVYWGAGGDTSPAVSVDLQPMANAPALEEQPQEE